jgi:hypothetical protein
MLAAGVFEAVPEEHTCNVQIYRPLFRFLAWSGHAMFRRITAVQAKVYRSMRRFCVQLQDAVLSVIDRL